MISKRYGKKPSEFKDQSISDYQFDLLVAYVGSDQERKDAEKINKKMASKGRR